MQKHSSQNGKFSDYLNKRMQLERKRLNENVEMKEEFIAKCFNIPLPFSSIKFDEIFVSSNTSRTSFCCKPALLAESENFS